MVFIQCVSTDASFCFALEKYLMDECDVSDSYFLIWHTDPTVMVGRFQNTIDEVNMDYVRKHNIAVVRRITGGGAVYTDLGCWNYSFIIKNPIQAKIDFEPYSKLIETALNKLGLNAYKSGRNDILVYGKKVSGNAQYISKHAFIHHGTLLFDTDLNALGSSLKVDQDHDNKKHQNSAKDRVKNISTHLPEVMSSEQFIYTIVNEAVGDLPEYTLKKADIKRINQIKSAIFDTWEWNYGKEPEFNIVRQKSCRGGIITACLLIENNIISNVRFFGDFFEQKDISHLIENLTDCAYEPEAIKQRLIDASAEQFLYHISADDLFSLLI